MITPLKTYDDYEMFVESFKLYVEAGIRPGSFLMAVLENNLVEAVGRADARNINRLPSIIQYVYENLPHGCWGSVEIVQAHLDKKRKLREQTKGGGS